MKAAVVTSDGVKVQEAPAPTPQPSQVLVRVRACGLNRADLGVAAGRAHGAIGGAGTIVGMEFAGEVAEVGSEVRTVKVGDRVMASGAAGYAEYAVADWGRVHAIPSKDMTFERAATLPVALQTMHNALVTVGGLKKGETVLIQGATSGVARRAKLKEWGADLAIDTANAGWADEVIAATDGKGVHLIVDQISASVANANMKAARVLGRIVNVGRLGGAKGEFDYDLHAMKRLSYIGVTFRTRSVEEVREINRLMRADLWDAAAAGKLKLPIDKTFALADVVEALAYMKANKHFGKIVLRV